MWFLLWSHSGPFLGSAARAQPCNSPLDIDEEKEDKDEEEERGGRRKSPTVPNALNASD